MAKSGSEVVQNSDKSDGLREEESRVEESRVEEAGDGQRKRERAGTALYCPVLPVLPALPGYTCTTRVHPAVHWLTSLLWRVHTGVSGYRSNTLGSDRRAGPG